MADDLEMFYHLWADEGWKSLLFSVYLIWKRKRVFLVAECLCRRIITHKCKSSWELIMLLRVTRCQRKESHPITLNGGWVSGNRKEFLELPPILYAHLQLGRPCIIITVLSSPGLCTHMWGIDFSWVVEHWPTPPLSQAPLEGQDHGHTRDLMEPTFQEEETDNSRCPSSLAIDRIPWETLKT